jgi:hypothetical protein
MSGQTRSGASGRPAGAPPAGRGTGESGALVAEFALVLPLLVALVLGIFEFGMAWRESLNLASAVRSGARQVTNAGDVRPADYLALQGFQSTMERARNVEVGRVSIYRTTSADGAPTNATCLTTVPPVGGTGVNGACNIYSRPQLESLGASYLTNFGPANACGGSAWDRYWCPLNRNADQGDPPDYVGFFARVTYTSYTGLLPTTITLSDRAVMRIEPKVT